MKPRYFFSIIWIIAIICACDDGIPENLEFDQFKKLYLSAASSDAKKVTLLGMNDTSFVFGQIVYGGTTRYGQGNITGDIATDFSLVDAYNVEHKTSFEPLPEESFAFDKTKLVIENGENCSGMARLFVTPGGLDAFKEYLLPVTIKSTTGAVALNEEKKTAYWIFVFGSSAKPVQKDIYPLNFENSPTRMTITQGDGFVTLNTTDNDPYISTTRLGRPLSDGATRVLAFEYKSNKTVNNAQFFYCVAGGAQGGKSSLQNIVISEASDWTRFEFDLSDAITQFGWGVDNSGGREPAEHFFRFDPTGDAGYEISIRNMQVEVFTLP